MTIQEFIDLHRPCQEARDFLLTQPDLQMAWLNCNQPEWMLWALNSLSLLTQQKNAALSAAFVRETQIGGGRFVADLLTDERSLNFLRMKEEWGASPEGTPRPEGWAASSDAAWSAALDASSDVARDAAWSAAWSAAKDAAWSVARDASSDVAWSVTWSVTRYVALEVVRPSQCSAIRRFIPNIESAIAAKG